MIVWQLSRNVQDVSISCQQKENVFYKSVLVYSGLSVTLTYVQYTVGDVFFDIVVQESETHNFSLVVVAPFKMYKVYVLLFKLGPGL